MSDNPAEEVGNGPVTQKYLGSKGLVVLLAMLSAFIPLSIDLYLPALPGMSKTLNAPVDQVNLTLTVFFVCYAFGMLIWGSLSDKYGRKTILRTGLVIYCGASVGCALSGGITQLILFRALQAIGGSGATSVSMAIVKDVYRGRNRETILATVQTMVIIAPVIAPVLGAFILKVTSWHGIFWTLSVFGIIAVALSFLLQETLVERTPGNPLRVISRLFVVLKNPGFSLLLLTFSMTTIPFLAFIASSSYIYINGFKLNAQEYSFFFAANAVFAMLGPMIYIRLSMWLSRRTIIIACFGAVILSGVLLLAVGDLLPLIFALSMIPATMGNTMGRPPSANLMLEQQDSDTGSASSLIAFSGLTFGSIGMLIISMKWSSYIFGLGILNIVCGCLSEILWLTISRRSIIRQVSNE